MENKQLKNELQSQKGEQILYYQANKEQKVNRSATQPQMSIVRKCKAKSVL